MNSPEEREACRRIEEAVRRSAELCKVSQRELLHHADRADRFFEAGVAAAVGRRYGQLTTAIAAGLLDDLDDYEAQARAMQEHDMLREDYANSTGQEAL